MWRAFLDTVALFLKGKLFRDVKMVIRQALIGNAIAAALVIGLAKIGIPLFLAIIVGAVVSGAMQPWLFKDLKYA